MVKLRPFEESGELSSYVYKKSEVNLDFVPDLAWLTRQNATDGVGERRRKASAEAEVKPYANLCGLLALPPAANVEGGLGHYRGAVSRAAARALPCYS